MRRDHWKHRNAWNKGTGSHCHSEQLNWGLAARQTTCCYSTEWWSEHSLNREVDCNLALKQAKLISRWNAPVSCRKARPDHMLVELQETKKVFAFLCNKWQNSLADDLWNHKYQICCKADLWLYAARESEIKVNPKWEKHRCFLKNLKKVNISAC